MALELVDYNICFIHIPRTGGRWVERALENAGVVTRWAPTAAWVHQRTSPCEGLIGEFDFYFTFIRHPKSWYESWWKYARNPNWPEEFQGYWSWHDQMQWCAQACIQDLIRLSFDEFVNEVLSRFPNGYLSQVYNFYVGGCKNSHRRVNFIGRYEHLFDDLTRVLKENRVKYDERALAATPKVGNTPIIPLRWDMKTIKRLYEVECDVFDKWYQ